MSAKFNLRPSLDLRFKPDEAKAVMKEVVNPLLDTVEVYDSPVVSELAQRISQDVVGRLKLNTDRVKEEEALRPTTAVSLKSVTDSGIGICIIFQSRRASLVLSNVLRCDRSFRTQVGASTSSSVIL